MAGRKPNKPVASRKRRSQIGKNAPASILERLTGDESAAVLRILLERHQVIRTEAEKIATGLVSPPSLDTVANDVFAGVTFIGIDALNHRAGKKPWGYVEPSEAAWELLEEAVEPVIVDMKRRMELGLADAAKTMCRGLVIGLHTAEGAESDGPLGWAPDFPAEAACHAVAELIRAAPTENRKNTREDLLDALAGDVPDWSEMLQRAAKRTGV
jgi:hypothetical protein